MKFDDLMTPIPKLCLAGAKEKEQTKDRLDMIGLNIEKYLLRESAISFPTPQQEWAPNLI